MKLGKSGDKGFTDSTIALRKSKIRQFFRFCLDETEDIRFSRLLKKMKGTRIIGEPIKPQDILTPEDIKRAINACTIERDRCIIATLFESGMRIGELLALKNSMLIMDEQKQEVTFNIPNIEGCKTGSRPVVCLEIYGYVQDWMKCNTTEDFIPLSKNGVRVKLTSIFKRAGITKPSYPHIFRHSAITHAVNIGMQPNAISMRFWGNPNSNMLNVYIHLNEQMTAQGYRNAKGMNSNGITVINPLAVRCVDCGRFIQNGSLCKQCAEIKELKERNAMMQKDMEKIQKFIEIGGMSLLKK